MLFLTVFGLSRADNFPIYSQICECAKELRDASCNASQRNCEADERGLLWASRNGDEQRRADGNRAGDVRGLRSGQRTAMVGVAARKLAGMYP